MEVVLSQLAAARLNKLLPQGYKLEPSSSVNKESRHDSRSKKAGRRSEADILESEASLRRKQPRLEKRIAPKVSRDLGYEVPKQRLSEVSRNCYKVLNTLKKHPLASPFLQPVDPVALGIPDYHSIVEEPMDLSTVEANLKANVYQNIFQFGCDVRKIWTNSFKYNQTNSDMYNYTVELSSCFEKNFKELEEHENEQQPKNQLNKLQQEVTRISQIWGAKENGKAKKDPCAPMDINEKRVLGMQIRKLDTAYLRGIIDIVNPVNPLKNQTLEFDINKLPGKVQRELERYVNESHRAMQKNARKKRPNVEGIDESLKQNQQRQSELMNKLNAIAAQQTNSGADANNANNKGAKSPQSSSSSSSSSEESESEEESKAGAQSKPTTMQSMMGIFQPQAAAT